MTAEKTRPDGIDLTGWEFWERPLEERHAAFRTLRYLPRPAFFREPEMSFLPTGPGYYALVSHADVVEASRRPTSAPGRARSTSMTCRPTWASTSAP
ncbi:hypothetical protein GCM10029978_031000 [Actinoallomurus acanthiterrae]